MVTDAEGGETKYTYTRDNQINSVKDAVTAFDNVTSYQYDIVGRLIEETNPLGSRSYKYDLVNNRTEGTDRNSRVIRYGYDDLNRLESEFWVNNGKTFTYTYDRNGNRISADDGNLRYEYQYDRTDLLDTVDRIKNGEPQVSFAYFYDDLGNLINATESINGVERSEIVYEYNDPRYLNTKIIQSGNGLAAKEVRFTYNAAGLNTQVERYVDGVLGVSTTNTYDEFGRLTGIGHRDKFGVSIASSSYDLDEINRLKSEVKDGVSREVGYDQTDQVKTVAGANAESYEYDLNGNRTNAGYVTDSNNRLMSDGVYSYGYDAEGNRVSRTRISSGEVDIFTWDYRYRLTGIVTQDGSNNVLKTVGYEYDVDDQRVSKTVDGVRENYYLDRNQIAFVTDGDGLETFHYLYGLDVDAVLAQDSSTGMVWSLADRLGSIDLLTDKDGTVVDKRSFDSFGRLISQSNPTVSFRYGYTGRELDLESGLHYYRARFYDAGVGRFISVDPMGFDAGDTNLYRYVSNNSTNATDPSGLILANIGSGLLNVAIDAGIQYLTTGKVEDINSLALSFGTGFLGYGLAAKAGTLLSKTATFGNVAKKYSVATSVALNAVADGSVGAVAQIGANVATGKEWSNNVWETATSQALFGAGGTALTKGAGGAWKSDSVQDLVQRGMGAVQKTKAWGVAENALAKATSVGDDLWNVASGKLGKLNQATGDLLSNARYTWDDLISQPAFVGGGRIPSSYAGQTFTQQVGEGFQHFMAMAENGISRAKHRFTDILKYRQNDPLLPNFYSSERGKDGVVAILEVNGKQYIGQNGWIGKSKKTYSLKQIAGDMRDAGFKPNSITPTHAEGSVFYQALKDDNFGGKATLYVDSTFCKPCGLSKGVENMARAMGYSSLEAVIRLPNGHIITGIVY